MEYKVLNSGSSNICHYLLCSEQQMLRLALLILSMFFPLVHSFNNFTSDESLDVLLQDLAFKALLQHRPHTGALYKASLPANLAGMEISVVRLRSKTLWNRGANFSYIHIPLRSTLPMPHVKRILIVYTDLGNWSSYYYKIPGYSLVSSVVGFMAYDASNVSSNGVTKISLDTTGKPMEIRFRDLTFPQDRIRRRCAMFSADGMVYLSDLSTENVCSSRNQGYFSIVAPLKRKKTVRKGFVLGFVGVVLVCVVGIVVVKFVAAKKIHKMEREAGEGEELETIWIGTSKMFSAAVTRTHPDLEDASLS
ncbi:hypothetical protein HYC85_013162 [Camellia sinensis]|uniref:Uncharacterized protein n=1 Tax=Camellia sinensis TaxID=4442 RepID=A0A7J7H3W6_CAMSI|nr:hypothetical protein HYC85_013162 [Camellia sinensis]